MSLSGQIHRGSPVRSGQSETASVKQNVASLCKVQDVKEQNDAMRGKKLTCPLFLLYAITVKMHKYTR